ncbi:Alg13 [Kluyveromyces lactis]|nr:Alg13 [Kluyveromyces lactis]
MNNTVLVTCGATVSFPRLVKTVLDRSVIEKLKLLGYGRVMIQYGRGFSDTFSHLVEDFLGPFTEKKSCGIEVLDKIENLKVISVVGIEIYGFEFSHDIEKLIVNNIDLVISHAGTGSILDSLRVGKKLIVVVNDTLMDNHQQLIADKFEQQKLLWSVHANTEELLQALDRSENEELLKIGNTYNKQFEKLLYNVAVD